jgi:hypothetical protein
MAGYLRYGIVAVTATSVDEPQEIEWPEWI